jgi:glycosyltransferase involved in cell wall biosynthesis
MKLLSGAVYPASWERNKMADVSASVVIPVLNGEDTIGDLLAALTRQRRAAGVDELIVVDNGSTDRTLEIAAKYNIALLHEQKRGPSAARNRGLYHSQKEVVAYLDADTVPTRGWIGEICTLFEDPEVLIVSGKTISYPPSTPAERFIACLGPLQPEYDLGRKIFPFMSSRNLAVRREAALSIGGWAEDMPTAEDMDFCTRMRKAYGAEVVFQPDAVVFHKERKTDEQLKKQAWSYGEGLADMYLRYPQDASWGIKNSLLVTGAIFKRTIQPEVMRVGQLFGLVHDDQREFFSYLRFWSYWYWRGFFSMYRIKGRKSL